MTEGDALTRQILTLHFNRYMFDTQCSTLNVVLRKSLLLLGMITTPVIASAWVETSQSDFADGTFDTHIYASFRDGGTVEFVNLFDLNHDGWMDVCCSDGYGGSLRVYYGSSAGFSPERFFSVEVPGGGGCAVADLNIDGYAELVHTGWRGRAIAAIYWGRQSGPSPSNPLELPVADAEAVFVADLDRDGWLDLGFGSEDGNIYIYWGSESGYSIASRSLIPIGKPLGQNFAGCDVDKDGRYELFACCVKGATSQPIIKFENDRSWSLNWLEFSYTGTDPHGVTLADFDRNGWLDVVYSGYNDITQAWIYWGSPSGFTNRTILNPGPSYGGSAGCDLNDDGWVDLLFFRGNSLSPSEFQPLVYYNTGRTPWFSDSIRTAIDTNIYSSGGMVADFNGDGHKDIFVNNFGGTFSIVYWGPEWHTFTLLPCNLDHHSLVQEPGNWYDRSYKEEYLSSVFDAGEVTNWQRISWDDSTPEGASITMAVRTGNTTNPDPSWSGWINVENRGGIPETLASQFIQYRATLNYLSPAALPMLYEVRIDYGPPPQFDVGVQAILAPGGTVDSGTAIVPKAIVRNYGIQPAQFPVTMLIGNNYSETRSDSLAPGTADTVEFPIWNASPVGTLPVVCFTSLVGDENPANDTARITVSVRISRRHDIGTHAIITPVDTLAVGDTVIPRAIVRNFGTFTENYFNVRFRIGKVYDQTITVNAPLPPNSVAQVSFPTWIATTGVHTISCSTMLSIDENPPNDKLTRTIVVGALPIFMIAEDQSDSLRVGEKRSYRFYAYLENHPGDSVEIRPPFYPSQWRVSLFDSTGTTPLADNNKNGGLDLGFVPPNRRAYFTFEVEAPPQESLVADSVFFIIQGFLSSDTLKRDSAVLKIKLLSTPGPALSIHNFPNPFSDITTFVIGLPEDDTISLAIYNRAGERICRIFDRKPHKAGRYEYPYGAKNSRGALITPGTYYYIFEYTNRGRTNHIKKKLVFTGRK